MTLTVNTSEDVNNSLSTTCTSATDGKCTLRRAIIEASNTAPAARPITINFNLPTADPNYQREAPGHLDDCGGQRALPPLKTQSITNKLGQVTIDGASQPGGRTAGPKIFWDLNDTSFEVESTENVIRNLGFVGPRLDCPERRRQSGGRQLDGADRRRYDHLFPHAGG